MSEGLVVMMGQQARRADREPDSSVRASLAALEVGSGLAEAEGLVAIDLALVLVGQDGGHELLDQGLDLGIAEARHTAAVGLHDEVEGQVEVHFVLDQVVEDHFPCATVPAHAPGRQEEANKLLATVPLG